MKRAGVMVFASCRGTEYSYELDDVKHGAFTEALLEGLGEAKANLEIGGPEGRTPSARRTCSPTCAGACPSLAETGRHPRAP